MSTLRKQTRSGYTHISNELINAEGLSYRAKGIAMVLLSKPDDWVIRVEYLAHTGKEGQEAIRRAMKELAEYGYLMRDRLMDNEGHLRTVTFIADYPAYINVGTVESRIYGYEPKPTELAVSEGSVMRTSEAEGVGMPTLLVTPDKLTTDTVKVNRKSKKTDGPKPKKSYNPSAYQDL